MNAPPERRGRKPRQVTVRIVGTFGDRAAAAVARYFIQRELSRQSLDLVKTEKKRDKLISP
jgi:hypothetical protein